MSARAGASDWALPGAAAPRILRSVTPARTAVPAVPDRRLTWVAYVLMLVQGFIGYSVSYFTPYIERELRAPTWASSTPNGAMAVGYLVAAFLVPAVVRRLGPGAAIRLWAAGTAVAALLLALGLSLWTMIAGAFLVGLTGAGVVVHTVSTIGSQRNGLYMVRSTVWSMFGALLAPLILWAATQTTGWSTGVLLAVPIALLVTPLVSSAPAPAAEVVAAGSEGGAAQPSVAGQDDGPRPGSARASTGLGQPYWIAFTYLVLVIGGEFAFVAWGAQVVVARTGINLAVATALASCLVGGELAGRILWATGIGARADRVRSLRVMTLVAAAGAVTLWVAPVPIVAGVGLALGGIGIALAFPVTSSLALAYAAHAPVRAGALLNVSWGLAILAAPLVLGVAAGAVGVTSAWGLTVALLAGAWLVIMRAPRPAETARSGRVADPVREAEPGTAPAP